MLVLEPCQSYSPEVCRPAMARLLKAAGGLDWVRPGMTVGVKVNLVAALKPESAATTHPALVCALVELLREKGADVLVGDSPGGLFNGPALERIYSVTGMKVVEAVGGQLNRDFSCKQARFPEAKSAKRFEYTGWLDSCDALINFCKLKTHGMMGLSAAVKNLFGAVPGTRKPEMHYQFPQVEDFANMLVDLNEYFRPRLNLVDAVVGMEGNGPTMGTPRPLGLLLADENPYRLDTACAALIGEDPAALPILSAARARGLLPEDAPLPKELTPFLRPDWNRPPRRDIRFVRGTPLSPVLAFLLQSRPKVLPAQCVGCGKCARVCPAKAIRMQRHHPSIDRKACIRCFCCQEFCPRGAMISHRSAIARLLTP